jgi:hypothetical protein
MKQRLTQKLKNSLLHGATVDVRQKRMQYKPSLFSLVQGFVLMMTAVLGSYSSVQAQNPLWGIKDYTNLG